MLLVSFIVFGLSVLIPGDAAVTLAGGQEATQERIDRIREDLGFDKPFLEQYGNWLGDAARGDFGDSLVTRQSVSSEIIDRLPVTLSIVGGALVIGLLLGVPAGLLAGMRPGSRLDRSLMFGTTLGLATPNFWLSILLVSTFAVQLGWFPAIGFTRFSENPIEWARSLFLPSLSLGVLLASSVARQLRASLADVMSSNYIRTMWAKGGTPSVVVAKHAFKNASIPAITITGVQIGGILGGTVIIEQIFAIPGLGTYMVRAIGVQDLPVIQGISMFFVVATVLLTLIVDLAYTFVNPKVRVS